MTAKNDNDDDECQVVNCFVDCCQYLIVNLSNLSFQNRDILNLGTGSVSWFESHGPGCKPTFPTNFTQEDPFRPVRPDSVDNCLLDYHIVEAIQSSVQIFLAVSFITKWILMTVLRLLTIYDSLSISLSLFLLWSLTNDSY